MSISRRTINFSRRWNYAIDQSKAIEEFITRTMNSIAQILSVRFVDRDVENEYLLLIGKPMKEIVVKKSQFGEIQGMKDVKYSFHASYIAQCLKNEEDFICFLKYLQTIFWMKSISQDEKNALFLMFREDILTSNIQITIKKIGHDIVFYPSGAKLLDKHLVDDVLDWTLDYKLTHASFLSALDKYQRNHNTRNCIDDLRVSFEQLLKVILKNGKSLENQDTDLGQYLKNKLVSAEIRNMFFQMLKYYSLYQNKNVKHGINFKDFEIEFILYQTGSLIRFLITLENLA